MGVHLSGIKNTFGPKTESKTTSIEDMRCLLCDEQGHGARRCTKSPKHVCGVCKNVHFTDAHHFLVRNFKDWNTVSKEDQVKVDEDDAKWGFTNKKEIAYHAEIEDNQLEYMIVGMR